MSEEQRKILENYQQTETIQGRANKQIQQAENTQNLATEILKSQSSQTAATHLINQTQISIESLLTRLNEYAKQNITPYTRKNETEYSENYRGLYIFCTQLPQYISVAIANGGNIAVPHVGIPDQELLSIIEDWINSYLEQIYGDENLQANFVIPNYQMHRGDTYGTVYKKTDVLRISIQKREKTK